MSSVDQKEISQASTGWSISHQKLAYAVSQVTNLTNDGGTRLLLAPSQINSSARQSSQPSKMSIYLLFFSVVAEVIAKTTTHMFPTQPLISNVHSQNLPHLEAIEWMKTNTGLKHERIVNLLGVSRQTMHRWENGEPIKDANRQRIYAVRDVLERAARRHSTPEQLTAWLDTPRGADGYTPAELLANNDINRARLLAVSSPSLRLVRAPAWVNRPIPEAFHAGAEHRQEAISPNVDDELSRFIDDEQGRTDEDGKVFPLI
jgi:DNA-binding transcriptional regulator YiaG